MLLGGSRYLLPVIEAAHNLGLHVITCDYLPDNPAHKSADEYCNVSIIDKEATLAAARRLQIDGILSFACDPGVTTAAYVAEQLDLPASGPYASICILQNKGRFRQFLADNGFTVPTAKGYDSIEAALQDTALFHWPVIVKPADSAGSKGVTRVDTPDALEQSIRYALSFSHCDEFIIEDFIEKQGFSSDSDGFSINGELRFVSFSSQRFDENAANPYTPAAYSWPSSLSPAHQQELTSELQRLIRLLGMKTSIYNIEVREGTDGKAYIMELSPRGGGNRLSEMLRYATGVDLITNAVRAAVGMDVVDVEQKPFDSCWAEVILHGTTAGVFQKLWVADEIRGNIVEEDLWITPGTPIGDFSGANEAIGTLVLKFETEERLQQVMNDLPSYVKVLVE